MSAPFISDEQPSDEPVFRWFRSIVRGIPRDYTVKTFFRRMIDHTVVYSAILAASVFIVFFLARPIEMGVLALVVASIAAVIIEARYGRQVRWSQRLGHIAEFLLAGSCVLAAGFLTKLAQQLF